MYKKIGRNSILTISLTNGQPSSPEAKSFVEKLRQGVKGMNKRVVLKGRKPIVGGYLRGGTVHMDNAKEADVYIYDRSR